MAIFYRNAFGFIVPQTKTQAPRYRVTAGAERPVRIHDHVGELAAFGIKRSLQIPLIIPNSVISYARPYTRFLFNGLTAGAGVCVAGRIGEPEILNRELHCTLSDFDGRQLPVTFRRDEFENLAAAQSFLGESGEVYIHGVYGLERGKPLLTEAHGVAAGDRGRINATYPGRSKKLRPDETRRCIQGRLDSTIPLAADFVRERLFIRPGSDEWRLLEIAEAPDISIEGLLYELHCPSTAENWVRARRAIERLAAMELLQEVAKQRVGRIDPAAALSIPRGTYARMRAMLEQNAGFRLTPEQDLATREILTDIIAPRRMHRVLSADCGLGKTEVFGLAAACVAEAGYIVAILAPRDFLVAQHEARLRKYFPHLRIIVPPKNSTRKIDAKPGTVIIGFTGIWSRLPGIDSYPSLVVCDEQQKTGVAQRNPLYHLPTHLLEVTATPIPRTEGLIAYGGIDVSRLKERHVERVVHTKMVETDEERQALYRHILAMGARDGEKVLIVYPKVHKRRSRKKEPEEGEDGDSDTVVRSVIEAHQRWEVVLPGRVAMLHGQMPYEEKMAAFEAFASRPQLSVLVTSVIVEIGVNLPNVRMVVIQSPERHGVSVSHQIRGRAAREGGEGWCYLVCPDPLPGPVHALVKMMEREADGHALAQADMQRRGYGDLKEGGTQQSGAYEGFLVGRKPGDEAIKYVFGRCQDWISRSCPAGADPRLGDAL